MNTRIYFDTQSVEDYRRFLAVRRLPLYRFVGTAAEVPAEYLSHIGIAKPKAKRSRKYEPIDGMFDYQRDIASLAIARQKYAIFADCGLGKTLMLLEFARHVALASRGGRILIVCPLMVVSQTISEALRWYGERFDIGQVRAMDLQYWLENGDCDNTQIGVTNYEAIREGLRPGKLAGLILDESSMLKSHYGEYGTRLIELGRGLDWKLCATGTPAPNDRIEFANHAVFLDRCRTVNEFLATYFINRGETQNRWELKPHALKPFYRSLADWSIFLTNPATYGWKDNVGTMPPMHVHIEHIELTPEQRKAAQSLTGSLITNEIGGIGERGKLSQIAKGKDGIPTLKPAAIRAMVDSWPDESTIIWCNYNDEQDQMEQTFPEAVSISGDTPQEKRQVFIDWFQGRICRCEMLRRTGSTCKSTIETTSIDGISEQKKSRKSTTQGGEKNMPQMRRCETNAESKQKPGNETIPEKDSIKTSNSTASTLSNTSNLSSSSEGSVQSVSQLQKMGIKEPQDCMSTIATSQELSEGCCAETAITASENSRTARRCLNSPRCTCERTANAGRILISKPRILGYGLNLQACTRQIFSGLKDSYEEFYQAVKRSNRIGSTKPLNVHIPVTELEVPFVDNVLRKADRVEADTKEQEALFKEVGHACIR